MLDTYQDRGIIKWSAFDALNGFNSMLKEMRYRFGQKERPTLSPDDFETMNRTMQIAQREHSEVEVIYFEDGYSKATYGTIKKVDYTNKRIVFSTLETISAFDILSIDLL